MLVVETLVELINVAGREIMIDAKWNDKQEGENIIPSNKLCRAV